MGVGSIPAASRGGPRPPPSDEHPLVPRSWDTEWRTERGRRADDCPTMHRASPTEPQSSWAPSDSSPRFGRARNLCGRGSRPPARQDQLSGPGWRRPLRAARGLDRYELPCPDLPWLQHASEAGFSRLAWHRACRVCHQPPCCPLARGVSCVLHPKHRHWPSTTACTQHYIDVSVEASNIANVRGACVDGRPYVLQQAVPAHVGHPVRHVRHVLPIHRLPRRVAKPFRPHGALAGRGRC